MKLLQRLIEALPNIEAKDVIIGVFDTAVLSKRWGIASTLKPTPSDSHMGGIKNSGHLTGMPIKQLAEYALSKNVLQASLGLAAINSAIEIDHGNLIEINAVDILMEHSINKEVAIIGHFPFVEKLKIVAKNLYIIEKYPRFGDIPENMTKDILPHVDVLALTATSLTNHTFEQIIELISPSTFVVMLGPSTPLSKILFDFGIDVASGSLIKDYKLLLRYLLQGASYRQLKGVSRVTLIKQQQ